MDQIETVDFVKKYLENLLTFFDLNLTVAVDVDDDIIVASIPSNERNSLLIGRGAETLRSIQSILSAALRNNNAAFTRISVDIADYKKQHAEKVTEQAREWINEVRNTGDSKVLNLNSADRWTVHHVASEYSDISTHSEGEGRDRRLIISQKSS